MVTSTRLRWKKRQAAYNSEIHHMCMGAFKLLGQTSPTALELQEAIHWLMELRRAKHTLHPLLK